MSARWTLIVALVGLVVLLPGCLEQFVPKGTDEEWYLGGSWTPEYTKADLDAWCEIAKEYGNECAIMESFPPQFGLRFQGDAACNEARYKILLIPHTNAGDCRMIERSDDPDAPTSSPVQPPAERWYLGGSFTAGYTSKDIQAWCAIAEEYHNSCALMKSEPPQFNLELASAEECEAARARIAEVPHVQVRECVRGDAS